MVFLMAVHGITVIVRKKIMSKYRAIVYWSGCSEGYGNTEEEALSNAEYNMPLDANTDSCETFCEHDWSDEDDD